MYAKSNTGEPNGKIFIWTKKRTYWWAHDCIFILYFTLINTTVDYFSSFDKGIKAVKITVSIRNSKNTDSLLYIILRKTVLRPKLKFFIFVLSMSMKLNTFLTILFPPFLKNKTVLQNVSFFLQNQSCEELPQRKTSTENLGNGREYSLEKGITVFCFENRFQKISIAFLSKCNAQMFSV